MFGNEKSFNTLLLGLRSVEVVKYLFSEVGIVILPELEQLLAKPSKAKFGRNILLVLLLLLSKMRSRETKELLFHLVNRIAKNDNILGCDIAEAVEELMSNDIGAEDKENLREIYKNILSTRKTRWAHDESTARDNRDEVLAKIAFFLGRYDSSTVTVSKLDWLRGIRPLISKQVRGKLKK
jgi:hypothetical protein